jgi:hypothetical protein
MDRPQVFMLKLVYTENVVMFGHSGRRELWSFENFVSAAVNPNIMKFRNKLFWAWKFQPQKLTTSTRTGESRKPHMYTVPGENEIYVYPQILLLHLLYCLLNKILVLNIELVTC